MSESVPSRSDAVDADSPTSPSSPTGDLVPVGEVALVSPAAIEQMAERLRFYESFDELIQQNIARSGQLMREAADKRDEAVAAIARSREQIEAERETQRAALTELLDDVMTIQQATERLAHRVSDALEQIEYELEPVGLQTAASLRGQSAGRLPDQTEFRADIGRSVAEDVDDEYRHGVLGQRRSPDVAPRAVPVSDDIGEKPPYRSDAAIAATDRSIASTGTNPELSGPSPDGTNRHDFANPTEQLLGQDDVGLQEPAMGGGPEATPVESSATGWSMPQPEPAPPTGSSTAGTVDMPRPDAALDANPPHREGPGTTGEPAPGTDAPSNLDAPAVSHDAVIEPPVDDPATSVEQQTTVVLDGVPRAAIALAIQRHLLAKPDVLRAEVREYYDHRLTLFITARRTTTVNDLQDWDGAGVWEQVRSSPELLELRMVM